MAQLRLDRAYAFLRRHGLADEARALAQSDDRIPDVSEAQLKRAKLVRLLEEHKLFDAFLEQEYPNGIDRTLRLHLSRLNGLNALMETYGGTMLTTRSLREAERIRLEDSTTGLGEAAARRGAVSASANLSSARKSGWSFGAVMVVFALVLLVIVAVIPGRNDDSSGAANGGTASGGVCANEGGSLRRWVSLDGSQIFTANPHLADVNEIVVCAGSGRPVTINGHPY